MLIQPLPAFNDNYLWLAHDGKNAVVVDPGDAQPVLAALQAQQLTLQAIVLTHHHGDHTGGVAALRQATQCRVLGPAQEKLPEPVERMHAGQRIALLGTDWLVLAVPGHTAGHIAWYAPDLVAGGALFCGDTLFSAGCGRLFEGTPEQMHASLQQLALLPFTELKLDRSFVDRCHADPAHLAIIESSIELARKLGEGTLGQDVLQANGEALGHGRFLMGGNREIITLPWQRSAGPYTRQPAALRRKQTLRRSLG